VVATGSAQTVAYKSFCLVYPHTLHLLEQKTGSIGVLTPSCSFDDDEDNKKKCIGNPEAHWLIFTYHS